MTRHPTQRAPRQLSMALLVLLLLATGAQGSSIFSPLGLGVSRTWTDARSAALAGSDLALADSMHLVLENPADWHSRGLTRFVVSARMSRSIASDDYGSDASDNFGFPGMAIAVPLFRSLGAGLYYRPETDFNFLIFSDTTFTPDTPIDSLDDYAISRRFQGQGGISRAGGTVAMKPRNWLTLGLGADFHFGTVKRLWTSTFDEGNLLRGGMFIRHDLAGWSGRGGVTVDLGRNLTLAGTVVLPTRLDVVEVAKVEGGDSTNTDGHFYELPLKTDFGFGLRTGRLRWSGIVGYEFWDQTERDVTSNSTYVNRWRIGLGLTRLPLTGPLDPWFERWTYRFGLRAQNHYLEIGGNPLVTYGLAAGVGIPVGDRPGVLDLAVTVDRRGDIGSNLGQELIYGVQLGIASTERWFVRRKR